MTGFFTIATAAEACGYRSVLCFVKLSSDDITKRKLIKNKWQWGYQVRQTSDTGANPEMSLFLKMTLSNPKTSASLRGQKSINTRAVENDHKKEKKEWKKEPFWLYFLSPFSPILCGHFNKLLSLSGFSSACSLPLFCLSLSVSHYQWSKRTPAHVPTEYKQRAATCSACLAHSRTSKEDAQTHTDTHTDIKIAYQIGLWSIHTADRVRSLMHCNVLRWRSH